MKAIRSIVSAGLLAAAVLSARGEEPTPALAGARTACGLLSRRTVEEASGVRVAEGVPQLSFGSVTSCSFEEEHGGRVMILARSAPASDWANEQVARMIRGVTLGTYREVSGIGERAFVYTIRGSGAVLCIFGTQYYLQISLFRMGEEPQIMAVLAKLAASALARQSDTAQTKLLRPVGRSGTCPTRPGR
ncbi:MAG: hypothetical protein WCB12_15070 [Bryobacteraceae bacterium]